MTIEEKIVSSVIDGIKALYGQDATPAQVAKDKERVRGTPHPRGIPLLEDVAQRSRADGRRDRSLPEGELPGRGNLQRHQGIPQPHHLGRLLD